MVLANKITELKRNLEEISDALSELSDVNFSMNINKINTRIKTVNNIKEELKTKYNINDLKKYEAELSGIAKLIQRKYDSIIESKKTEEQDVSQQLKNMQNKKKLANYR